jgi:uncharacterized protein (TIGR02996 family)
MNAIHFLLALVALLFAFLFAFLIGTPWNVEEAPRSSTMLHKLPATSPANTPAVRYKCRSEPLMPKKPAGLRGVAMSKSSEEAALWAAVCANPSDELVRLVYADWLEENDQVDRAEFIRFEIESARYELQGGTLPPDYTVRRRKSIMERARWVRELPEIRGVEWQDLYQGGFPSGAIVASVSVYIAQFEKIQQTIPLWSLTFLSAEPSALEEAARQGLFTALGQLDLNARGVGSNAITTLFAEGHCPRLEKLFIGSNNVQDPAVRFLARHGGTPKLRWIDLSSNPVHPEPVRELVHSQRLPDLRHIGLQWTRVGEQVVQDIREELRRRPPFPGVPHG